MRLKQWLSSYQLLFSAILRPGLQVEFYMRQINTNLSHFELKSAAFYLDVEISHVSNRICERCKHSDGHHKVFFFFFLPVASFF